MKNMDSLKEGLETASLDEDGIPEDLKKLIEETVEGNVAADTGVVPKTAVKASELKAFFQNALTELNSTEFLLRNREFVEQKFSGNDPREKMNFVRQSFETEYDKIWEKLGIGSTLGSSAVTGVNKILHDTKVDKDYRNELSGLVNKYKEKEQEILTRIMFGDDAYKSRLEQQKAVMARKVELQNELSGLTKEERGKRILELKQQAFTIRTKLMSMGGKNAVNYLKDLTGTEATVMNDLSALALLIQDGSDLIPKEVRDKMGALNGSPQNGFSSPANNQAQGSGGCKHCKNCGK